MAKLWYCFWPSMLTTFLSLLWQGSKLRNSCLKVFQRQCLLGVSELCITGPIISLTFKLYVHWWLVNIFLIALTTCQQSLTKMVFLRLSTLHTGGETPTPAPPHADRKNKLEAFSCSFYPKHWGPFLVVSTQITEVSSIHEATNILLLVQNDIHQMWSGIPPHLCLPGRHLCLPHHKMDPLYFHTASSQKAPGNGAIKTVHEA